MIYVRCHFLRVALPIVELLHYQKLYRIILMQDSNCIIGLLIHNASVSNTDHR